MIFHIITGLAQGGAETALYRLLCGVAEPTQHHVISLTGDGVFAPRLRALGVHVTCLNMRSPFGIIKSFGWLVHLVHSTRPEAVQTWMYHADLIGGLAAVLAGVPVYWGVRQSNLDPDANKRNTLWVARVCAWISSWLPKRIVSCSQCAIDTHRRFGYADRFAFVPNGLESSHYLPDASVRQQIRASLGLSSDTFVIGHVGRFDPQKDYPNLLTAFRIVHAQQPNVKLLLAGNGLREDNELFANLLGSERASLIALGPRTDIPALMQAFDLFVLSSLGEGFPNVVVEAMASGVPCVVTDVGDAAIIVGDTGWIVPAKRPDALASALLSALAESPLERSIRAEHARQRIAEHFTIQRMVQNFETIWAQARG